MKPNWKPLFFALTMVITFTSCKGEKKDQAETKAPEPVVKTDPSITYTVSTKDSHINWTGSKPLGKHTGTINIKSGTVIVSGNKITGGTFAIDMSSITVTDLEGDKKLGLEGHLKGEGEGKEDHFFNVAKFPEALFELTGTSIKDGKTQVEGNLTIKGIKKSISFPAMTEIKDTSMALKSESFTINRTEWGVNYGSKSVFENLGDKFINDDIEIKINLNATTAM